MRKEIFYSILWMMGTHFTLSIVNKQAVSANLTDQELHPTVETAPYTNSMRIEEENFQLQNFETGTSTRDWTRFGKREDNTGTPAVNKSKIAREASEPLDSPPASPSGGDKALAEMKWMCYLLTFVLIVLTILVLVVLAFLSYFMP